MIAPAPRLIFFVALVGLPFALLGTLIPAMEGLSLAAIGLLAALALIDAALAHSLLAGLEVEIPNVVRLTQGKAGVIGFQIVNPGEAAATLRIGLALPAEFESAEDIITVQVPAGVVRSRLDWPLQASRRGRYALRSCHLERLSHFGFWVVRAARPVDVELRVYPNLMPDCRSLAATFLRQGGVGSHRHRQVGQGREFEKLRDYTHGDALGDIHWKATAKRMRPVAKVFQIERTQEVYFIIDASRLSARRGDLAAGAAGAPGVTMLERFMSTALVACLIAERQSDRFGLIVFSDRVQRILPAGSGREHFSLCRDALYNLQPSPVTPDFGELFTTIRARLRRRALLIFLTNLDDVTLAEAFEQGARLVSRHHLMLVNQLRPRGAAELFSTENVTDMDSLYSQLAGHLQWQQLRRIEKALAWRGVRFSLLDRESMATQVVSQYLDVKQRQML